MTDKCKRCGRQSAPDPDALNADEEGLLCGRGLKLGERGSLEMYGDCCAHEAHVLRIRLMRAESLLHSAPMSEFMGVDYRRKLSERIDAFLAEEGSTYPRSIPVEPLSAPAKDETNATE